tara:strand:- start:73 stop:279 length:207 start_codon:yes stop_codon:yes gene_type:complete
MSKTYVIKVDSQRVIDADSEEEAFFYARSEFIEMLQRDEAQLIVEEVTPEALTESVLEDISNEYLDDE